MLWLLPFLALACSAGQEAEPLDTSRYLDAIREDEARGIALIEGEVTDIRARDLIWLEATKRIRPQDTVFCERIVNDPLGAQCRMMVTRPHLHLNTPEGFAPARGHHLTEWCTDSCERFSDGQRLTGTVTVEDVSPDEPLVRAILKRNASDLQVRCYEISRAGCPCLEGALTLSVELSGGVVEGTHAIGDADLPDKMLACVEQRSRLWFRGAQLDGRFTLKLSARPEPTAYRSRGMSVEGEPEMSAQGPSSR